jgi:hypothetical protein
MDSGGRLWIIPGVKTAELAQLVALLSADTLSIVVLTALLGRREAPGASAFLVPPVGVSIWALSLIQDSDGAADFWSVRNCRGLSLDVRDLAYAVLIRTVMSVVVFCHGCKLAAPR